MTVPCAAGSHIRFRSSGVRVSTQSFPACTTTAMPSYAMGSSTNPIPAAAHASISRGRMGRDALEMSVSPAQNFSKPPPVPDTPTVTRASGSTRRYSSATASAIGNTVLEPSTATTCAAPSIHPRHAAAPASAVRSPAPASDRARSGRDMCDTRQQAAPIMFVQ